MPLILPSQLRDGWQRLQGRFLIPNQDGPRVMNSVISDVNHHRYDSA